MLPELQHIGTLHHELPGYQLRSISWLRVHPLLPPRRRLRQEDVGARVHRGQIPPPWGVQAPPTGCGAGSKDGQRPASLRRAAGREEPHDTGVLGGPQVRSPHPLPRRQVRPPGVRVRRGLREHYRLCGMVEGDACRLARTGRDRASIPDAGFDRSTGTPGRHPKRAGADHRNQEFHQGQQSERRRPHSSDKSSRPTGQPDRR